MEHFLTITLNHEKKISLSPVKKLLHAIENDDDTSAKAAFEELKELKGWAISLPQILASKPPSRKIANEFRTFWAVSGHRVREQLDDDHLLTKLLRRFMPRYEGIGLELFRGEQLHRWLRGEVGFSWTTKIDVAQMFGGGLNAIPTGGVLLTAWCPPKSIIAGTCAHSENMEEFEVVVDPKTLANIEELERYRAIM